jgi:hypothetical protein
MRDIKADTQEIRNDTAAIPSIKEDTIQILAEIARLQAQLPKNVELQGLDGHGSSGFMLQRYLGNLTTYAETAYDTSDKEWEEETAPGIPRAVTEQEEIKHYLEHLNLSQDNTQELPKSITDGLFKDPDKELSLVYTISKALGAIIEDASVSADSSFDSPKSSLAGINESESYGSKKRDFSEAPKQPPSIRFIPHQDPRAARPSLVFPTISRTLPDESAVIRVGRYSERDNIPEIPLNVPSAAAVGFKSKVVSRKHCEFWCSNSQWYIKDVESSSGTFLNHIRLSQPNVESKPFKVKDGDVVQLGIDFHGGEEMISRCVKIRIECRGWQQGLNNFK